MDFKILFASIVCLFINTSVILSQEIDDKLENVLNDASLNSKGKISEENGVFSLYYFDVYEKDSHAKFFQDKGYHGGGPTWLAIIYTAFNVFEPNIINETEFDPQKSGITFKSPNKEDIEMIGRMIFLLKSDEKVLVEMIERAKKLEIMK